MVELFKVRMMETLKPSATKKIVTGDHVWAWVGNPLLGEIKGSKRWFKSAKEAKKYATGLRKLAKGGK